MEKINLVLLSVEDWEGLYLNGKLFDQGHSIQFERFLKSIIGQEIIIESFISKYIDLPEDNCDLEKYGNRFPDKLEEVLEYE